MYGFRSIKKRHVFAHTHTQTHLHTKVFYFVLFCELWPIIIINIDIVGCYYLTIQNGHSFDGTNFSGFRMKFVLIFYCIKEPCY